MNFDKMELLADEIEAGTSGLMLDMSSYKTCIAAHAVQVFRPTEFGRDPFKSAASEILDLNSVEAFDLFKAAGSPVLLHRITRQQAASVLRNARTNGVDWSTI